MTRARILVFMVAVIAVAFPPVGCKRREVRSGNAPYEMAANVLDIGVEALARDDGGPNWQELDRRLERLFANNSKEGDEAVVILMSFYLGEHNGEELEENVLSRGPRMMPILERYLREEPSSLIQQYPKRVRLERKTTLMFLKEDLEILRVQAGARRIASASVETATLRDEAGDCIPKLVQHPEMPLREDLVQPGESYGGAPVLRADIQESGVITNVQLLSKSGIQRLDTMLLGGVNQWRYAPRPHCGVVQANIVVTIDWMAPEPHPVSGSQ